MNPIIKTSRDSAADFCITFEVNGEKYTFCIGRENLDRLSKDDLIKILNDPLSCSLCCAKKSGFGACMLRCVEGDGKCCDSGATNCE